MDIIETLENLNINWLYLTISIFVLCLLVILQLIICLAMARGTKKRLIKEIRKFLEQTEKDNVQRVDFVDLLNDSLAMQEKLMGSVKTDILALDAIASKARTNDINDKAQQKLAGFIGELSSKLSTVNVDQDSMTQITRRMQFLIKTIDKLSCQTSVLSVGATVEIAKADTQYRGFVIVLDEIKKLVAEMASNIYELGDASRDLVQMASKGSATVKVPDELVQDFQENITKNRQLLEVMQASLAEQQRLFVATRERCDKLIELKDRDLEIIEKITMMDKGEQVDEGEKNG